MNNSKTENQTKNTAKTSRPRSKKMVERSDETITSQDVQVKGIVSNISMLYNTIRDLKERGNFKQIERLNIAQDENFARLDALDAELGERVKKKYRTNNKGIVASRTTSADEDVKTVATVKDAEDQTDEMLALFRQTQAEEMAEYEYSEDDVKTEVETVEVPHFDDLGEIDEVYDVLNLPSNGQCYAHKKGKIAVSYLTATDENFITSPNLYRDGLITDCLLQRKVVDKTFDVNNLCSGDADAVLFFLRVSSYGADFPATFTDPDTGQSFETVIDLNQIKVKDFNLVGDENGYFDFELPVTKDKIKFRFLTKKDERKLEKLNQIGENTVKASSLRNMSAYLESILEDGMDLIDEDEQYQIEDSINIMNTIADKFEMKEGLPINKIITNRLEMAVMSVNGNTDKKYIRKYVRHMVARDSLALRRYILDNTPGLDFSIKIEKPATLGGGVIDTFLEWSDTVFLSIA